ncbi:5'/3'-nucleotidase SurE [Ferrimonas pelagia]|uniref:5'-nucleotidase n=1 Tax=Ferrimonas pelagia TaxID=1177826 RepID=A0ABP9ECI4_9GAMM
MALLAQPASALNILLTNDDGFETPNIQALYQALKADGHDVVIAAPYVNQSGRSASLHFFNPVLPTSEDSEHGAVAAGAPGVGTAPDDPDQHYVDGTPATAVLYGIDVVAQARWGQYPDLVISGPNEGNNLGVMANHSGTIGATVTALYRGVPAIAVSGHSSSGRDGSHDKIAAATMKLIRQLGNDTPVLPAGLGITLNLPSLAEIDTDELSYAAAQIGVSAQYVPKFVTSLGDDPLVQGFFGEHAARLVGLPGIALGLQPQLDSLEDTASNAETGLVAEGIATISTLNVTYSGNRAQTGWVDLKLLGLSQ